MKINEIFFSIQGEGKWAGQPNVFIRTTGCNLRCNYCDTKYAYYEGKEVTINQIADKINRYPCKKICLTGGEPLVQDQTYELIKYLLQKFKICLETNGSKDISHLPKNKNLVISMDVKCPSSRMHNKVRLSNIKYLTSKDVIKFVVKDKTDYNYTKEIIKNHDINCPVYIQPVWGSNLEKIAGRILKDGLDVTLGLQIQKIIWGEQKRGV